MSWSTITRLKVYRTKSGQWWVYEGDLLGKGYIGSRIPISDNFAMELFRAGWIAG